MIPAYALTPSIRARTLQLALELYVEGKTDVDDVLGRARKLRESCESNIDDLRQRRGVARVSSRG